MIYLPAYFHQPEKIMVQKQMSCKSNERFDLTSLFENNSLYIQVILDDKPLFDQILLGFALETKKNMCIEILKD